MAGILEVNFISPAHDKQGFERTAVFIKLETRLKQMTMEYWCVPSVISEAFDFPHLSL